MDKLFKDTKGFNLTKALLIVLAVVIVGFTGWYVYNATKKSDTTLSSTSQITKPEPKFTKTTKASGTLTRDASTNTTPSKPVVE